MLVIMLAFLVLLTMYDESFAEKSTFFDSVKFIQYLDENTALEEVRNGNLDLYYYTISPDRLEGNQNIQGLQVFDSTGGSYSILINPAQSETALVTNLPLISTPEVVVDKRIVPALPVPSVFHNSTFPSLNCI